MEIESVGFTYEWSALPPELLQVLGDHLSPAELRSARLSCKAWATALAVCMPSMTMSLPLHSPDNVFRQPLVLCSSGQLNSAQSVNYSAAPLPRMPHPAPAGASAAACAASIAAVSGLPGAASLGGGARRTNGSSSRGPSRPSPFATEGGQAAMRSSIREFTAGGAGMLPPSPFEAAASLPPGCPSRMEQQLHGAAVAAAPTPAAAAAVHPVLQWQSSGVVQSWCSLPTAGLRTCSSLQQLNLQLSGAPPSPQDLMDLTALPHLTHLSFRQLEAPPAAATAAAAGRQPAAAGAAASAAAAADAGGVSSALLAPAGRAAVVHKGPCASSNESGSSSGGGSSMDACEAAVPGAPPSSGMPADSQWGSDGEGEQEEQQAGGTASSSDWQAAASEYGSSSSSSDMLDELYLDAEDEGFDDTRNQPDQGAAALAATAVAGPAAQQEQPQQHLGDASAAVPAAAAAAAAVPAAAVPAAAVPAVFGLTAMPSQRTECVSCSVITPQHVEALARLPHLSSLELHPKQGTWDAAASAALLQLTMLPALTQLTLTWGSLGHATSGWQGIMSDAEAQQQAHGVQLPLQQCLLGLAGQLQELRLKGRAVVDVVVLQRLQKLRKLQAEALKVVNSDVVLKLEQRQEQQPQQQAGAAAGAAQVGGGDGQLQPAAGAEQQQRQQQRRIPKWATLPLLESLHVVHPDSDVSLLLQGTRTPLLSSLGFVSRGPSDFARLLAQHGKLRVLHLVFPEDEPWHPIAVVRLPTALPSLRSLTLEGKFWLPNSLIVALGVMEVPIEQLSLSCKLASPCLERLQHLTQLRRLALHHVAWAGHPADGLVTKDVMLQLPAKLLPPGLRDLEISNGWILH